MVSKRMRCLALISHNNMKPAMQACLLVPIVPTPLPRAARTLYLHSTSLPARAHAHAHAHVLHVHVDVAAHHQPQSYTFYPAHTTPAPSHPSALEPHPIAKLIYHAPLRNPPRPALAAQDFVKANTNILRRFRLTGTASTMKMLRSVMGEGIEYGPTCASGPLGGDAQVHVGERK